VLPERVELVPAGGEVEKLRAIKDAGEVERIRAAAALVDEIYGTLRQQGLVGRTEREVALTIELELRRIGAGGLSFPSIVASGARGALPHAEPTDEPIPRGTLVTLDIGARLDGYCSDCTRTWATGELPDDLADAYALVQRAQAEALAAVRPGPSGREVDAVARSIIEDAGHGDHFGHGLGHGVGMEIHEAPRLARSAEEALVAGHVVTVEPGVYIPGRGGVRIEDLVVVTEHGHSVISTTTKDLISIE
jgi:Xaa-Pro aminopeptidase